MVDWHVRHADGFLQERCSRAARDSTDRASLRTGGVDVVSGTGDALVEQFEAGDLSRDALGLLCTQRGGAQEVALVPAHDPAQAGFERRRRVVDVVAVETHGRFQPECIAGAESARNETIGLTRGQHRLPDAVGRLRRDEDFEAVFARITRP